MKYLAAFVAMLVTDWMWARYLVSASDGHAFWAGTYSAGLVLFSAVSVLLYVGDAWTILPAAAGAFVGTVWGVKR